MLVQILIIAVGFAIAQLYPVGIEPLFSLPTDYTHALLSIGAIIFLTLSYLLLGAYLVKRHLSILTDINARMPTEAARAVYYKHLFRYRLLLLPVYFIQVFVFNLPMLINTPDEFVGLHLGGIPFVTTLLTLVPFFITLILSYIPFYRLESHWVTTNYTGPYAVKGGTGSLLNYLSFQIRTYFLMAVLPLAAFTLFFELFSAIPALNNLIAVYPFVEWFIVIVLFFLLYLMAPYVLKYLWATESVPASPLRSALEALSKRADIRIKDFLIWPVGERPFANALVIGLFPFNRFVMVTDTVLDNLSDDEVTAVVAHEIGHAKHRHLLIFLLFTYAYLSILFALNEPMNAVIGEGILNFSISISLLLLFLLVVFRQISRRFELQADGFAAHIANPDSFVSALSKIATLNGIPFRTSGISSLTHPSIEKRISAIQDDRVRSMEFGVGSAPNSLLPTLNSLSPPSIRKIIIALVIVCALGLLGMCYTIMAQVKTAPLRRHKLEAVDKAQKAEELLNDYKNSVRRRGLDSPDKQTAKIIASISMLNEAIKIDPDNPYYYILRGDAYAELEETNSQVGAHPAEAGRKSISDYETADELQPVDPAVRYYLHNRLSSARTEK